MAMGKWLEKLRSRSEKTLPKALTKLTKGSFVSFVSGSNGGSRQNPGVRSRFRRGGVLTGELHHAVKQARDWQDLEAVLDRAQAAYERGELLQEQVEELALEAVALGRVLPQKAVYDGPVIWAHDLLPGDTC